MNGWASYIMRMLKIIRYNDSRVMFACHCIKVLLLVVCAMGSVKIAFAQQEARTGGFDFTLPTIDGARFVHLRKVSRPTVINFWGAECGPCVTELPRLERFSRDFPVWTVLLVSTDPLEIAQDYLARHPLPLTVLKPGADVSRLMRLAGNSVTALPFSVAINKANQICFRKIGELKEKDLERMVLVCQ